MSNKDRNEQIKRRRKQEVCGHVWQQTAATDFRICQLCALVQRGGKAVEEVDLPYDPYEYVAKEMEQERQRQEKRNLPKCHRKNLSNYWRRA